MKPKHYDGYSLDINYVFSKSDNFYCDFHYIKSVVEPDSLYTIQLPNSKNLVSCCPDELLFLRYQYNSELEKIGNNRERFDFLAARADCFKMWVNSPKSLAQLAIQIIHNYVLLEHLNILDNPISLEKYNDFLSQNFNTLVVFQERCPDLKDCHFVYLCSDCEKFTALEKLTVLPQKEKRSQTFFMRRQCIDCWKVNLKHIIMPQLQCDCKLFFQTLVDLLKYSYDICSPHALCRLCRGHLQRHYLRMDRFSALSTRFNPSSSILRLRPAMAHTSMDAAYYVGHSFLNIYAIKRYFRNHLESLVKRREAGFLPFPPTTRNEKPSYEKQILGAGESRWA